MIVKIGNVTFRYDHINEKYWGFNSDLGIKRYYNSYVLYTDNFRTTIGSVKTRKDIEKLIITYERKRKKLKIRLRIC